MVAGITISDLQHEIDRGKVDMHRARVRLREIELPHGRPISPNVHEEVHTIELLLLMETLRALPDGAGTSAFLSAYAERRQGRT